MSEVKFPFAERFVAPQGEGQYTGQVMAFARLVGCSVGKGVCHACDTEYDRVREGMGGGLLTAEELVQWVHSTGCLHLCLTGGEPLDRDLRPILLRAHERGLQAHIETSGTKHPDWLDPPAAYRDEGVHFVDVHGAGPDRRRWAYMPLWVTVSPKPGYLPEMVSLVADELKVILGGLGDGPGWPGLASAKAWACEGKLVYVQPRNHTDAVDADAMAEAVRVVTRNPGLRLSCQLHKYIRTR